MALCIYDFILSRIMGDTQRSIRFFVVSAGCRRVKERVGRCPRHKMAVVGTANFCAKGRRGVVFVLTGGERSAVVFQVVGSVSPGTFISRDTIVKICKRKFSRVGMGWLLVRSPPAGVYRFVGVEVEVISGLFLGVLDGNHGLVLLGRCGVELSRLLSLTTLGVVTICPPHLLCGHSRWRASRLLVRGALVTAVG